MRELPDAGHGEQATFQEDQRGAPMAMANPMPGGVGGGLEGGDPLVPFGAPTMRPDQSGQAGATMGGGMGPEALGLVDPAMQLQQADAERIAEVLPLLEYMANLPGAMPSTRQFVRRMKASM